MTRAQDVATDTSYAYAGPGQNELITRTVAGGDTTKYVYGRPSKYGVPMIDVMTVNGAKHYLDNDPDGTPLALELPSGGTGYFVLDGLGSVVALVDGQGNTDATYTYDPYGTQTASTGTGALADANPYRHTTGLHDPTTGLVKHGTRWNDTTTGRWTTVDPITRLTDPNQASWNPFDYQGVRCAMDLIGMTGAAIGTATSAAATPFIGVSALLVGLGIASFAYAANDARVNCAPYAGSY
jgi:RHS repeat-associated protein